MKLKDLVKELNEYKDKEMEVYASDGTEIGLLKVRGVFVKELYVKKGSLNQRNILVLSLNCGLDDKESLKEQS